MKEKIITVIYKKVGETPEILKIKNNLRTLQNLVGGLIEVLPYNDVLFVINEEGKIYGLEANIILDNRDYIAGNILVVGDDYESGEFKSLTDNQINMYIKDLEDRSINNKYNVYEEEEDDR